MRDTASVARSYPQRASTVEIRELLRRAAVELDRALGAVGDEGVGDDDAAGLDPRDLDVARYAVHRALVAIEPCEPDDALWPPPRVVALTVDEAVAAAGVIGLLCDEHHDHALDLLAKRTVSMLSERLAWASDGMPEWPVIDLDA